MGQNSKTVPRLLTRYSVRGHSMEPTLRAGERVLVSGFVHALRGPARGDVVAVRHPRRPGEVMLKRLIGLPGDRLEEVAPDMVRSARVGTKRDSPPADDAVRLGPDEYLVLGDRRDHSEDSRHFGPVAREMILGKVWLRYWPADRVGSVPSRSH